MSRLKSCSQESPTPNRSDPQHPRLLIPCTAILNPKPSEPPDEGLPRTWSLAYCKAVYLKKFGAPDIAGPKSGGLMKLSKVDSSGFLRGSYVEWDTSYRRTEEHLHILARAPMKGAAKCDNRCELQNSVNQWPLERALRSWDMPESMVLLCH